MSRDIVLDTAGTGARLDFFNFCDAPHGDNTKAIGVVFLDAKPYGFNLMTYNNGADLRNFLNAAHTRARPIKIEFLSGDKMWATPDYRAQGEAVIDEVTAFNLGGTANQRFDGIQYDVEPYLLNSKNGTDPFDWEYDRLLVWSAYLTLLSNCQTKINSYNSANNPDIRFGAAIPYWYVLGSIPGPQEVIDRVDYIAVMDYKDTASQITNGAQDEISYAASAGKKVYVGIETGYPTDSVEFPPSCTFYEEGNAVMEAVLAQVQNSFSGYSSYSGIAVHYYENQTGPKGYECAYRSLAVRTNHVPVVSVLSPNRSGESWAGSINIQWSAWDFESGVSLTIAIQYSANGGTTWTNIATGLTNTGSYLWNAGALAAGSNYLIKVSAIDAGGLSGYDVSNNTFTISPTVTQADITDLYLWNDSDTSLLLKWTPPSCTPRYYRIYRSVNGAAFPATPTYDNVITVNKYTDTGLSGSNKYKYKIKAVYGNGVSGNDSNTSNMLKPGNQFLMDYCDQNEEITYAVYGASPLSNSFDVVDKKEGNSSLKLAYNYSGSGWGAILIGTLPVKVDVSPYRSIKFWAKGDVVGTGFKLQLRETGTGGVDEVWETRYPVLIGNTNWNEYQISITKDSSNPNYFIRTEGLGNNEIDMHHIGGYAALFYYTSASDRTANGIYHIDEIKLLKREGGLSVPAADYTFGTVSGSISDHRFVCGPIPVSFGGFDSPWTVRIWTDNNPSAFGEEAAAYAGLKGADNQNYLPLKVWCVNFGPTGNVPDEENDTYWVNNQAGWFRIPEYNEMDPFNVYTWRRLCWAPGAELASPFNIYLAIDIADKSNQQYLTTTLTMEYINE